MKPFVNEIFDLDHIEAFTAVKHMPYSLLLDSTDRKHPSSRYSFVMCNPIETIHAKNGEITVTNWEGNSSFEGDPLEFLRSRSKSWVSNSTHIPNMPPFQGGAAGLFGYDLGRYMEDLPKTAKDNDKIPDMAVGIYDQVLARDHLLKKTYIFTHARNKSEADKKMRHFLGLLSKKCTPPTYQKTNLNWTPNFDKQGYMDQVDKVINYINEGDIFQANIAQRFDADLPENFDPFIHYLHLREYNPAPFSAYMNIGEIKISSTSPERFVKVRNRQVETSPIKGTRPRVSDFNKDRAYKKDLLASEKDNAENIMIVDLMRNDLSKVCEASSIEVSDLCKLETFTSVHHLVSTIRGKLSEGKDSIDLMKSCFPGGSITGAPKIRAMEIIEEIEPTRRGAYCGSMGYIGFDDYMDMNIMIRSLTYEKDKVSLQAGGGIVADSSAISEYEETIDKARAILDSFKSSPKIKATEFYKAS